MSSRRPKESVTGGSPLTAVLLCVLGSLVAVGSIEAAVLVVDGTGDQAAVAPTNDGICDADPTPAVVCTLRAAIQEANGTPGADTISFNIPPAGPKTIVLGSALPSITSAVVIDGTTQPGFVAAAPFAPVIELSAAACGSAALDLRGGSSGSTIRGLAINRCPQVAIRIAGSSNNVIAGNFLGTNLAGAAAGPGNQVGVYIGLSSVATNNNRVGGTAAADRNVISGNTADGIQINAGSGGTSGNVIEGNYIGVDVNGTAAVGNTNQGVALFVSSTNANTDNVIGGTAAGAGNVISGNGNDGVLIANAGTTGTRVEGNRIGTNAAGTAAIPNLRGIEIAASASGNTIGGTAAGAGNVISGNTSNGILINAASNNTVQRNGIGTDAAGAAPLGNGQHGIQILGGASGNLIGGASGNGNVISGNGLNGVDILQGGSSGNRVAGNMIGLDVTGTADLGNRDFGVAVAQGATGNVIGEAGGGNVISGNDKAGVRIVDPGTNNNLVQLNYVGLDVTGTLPRPNSAEGVILDAGAAASGNVIGGVGLGNVISGNGGAGIRILNQVTATTVAANIIGRDATNSVSVPNGGGGVRIEGSSGNTIGGTGAGAGNVIIGNSGGDGVAVTGAATGNAILQNSILANAGLGIDLGDDGVTPNDASDADSGANDLLNWPFVYRVLESGGTLTVDFALDLPAGSYRIEFFKNPSGGDPSGNGEGQVFAGSRNVTHGGAGGESFSHSFPGAPGDVVTATTTFCTDGATCAAFGSTSEFSNQFTVGVTAVELVSFGAVGRDGAVELSWQTGAEVNNLGFHLYRALSAGGPYERITSSLIPGLGSSPVGASYGYRDTAVTNGVPYFYELEDVETTGRTELHGPVSATPVEETSTDEPDGEEDERHETETRVAYGDPGEVSLRVLERDRNGASIELLTGGFFSTPVAGGAFRLEVPGFEESASPGSAAIPVKRAWLDAVAGRGARVAAVRALEVKRFPGLRPAAAGSPEIVARPEGTVRAGSRRSRGAWRGAEVVPPSAARVVETGFQQEMKKVLVELAPLRWDARSGQLLWVRRLEVRLSFAGVDSSDLAPGDVRGRRHRERRSHRGRAVLAQIATSRPGLYRVRFEDVFPGRGRAVASDSLRLRRLGEEVPYRVEPPVDRFGPGSVLYFVSPGGAANPYSNEAVFELESGSGGMRMPVVDAFPSGPALEAYFHRSEWEENRYYQAGLLEAPSLWLWDVLLSPGSKRYPFVVDSPAEGEAKLEVYLQGASDFEAAPDHHVRVSLNGNSVAEVTWDGKAAKTVEALLEPGLLQRGENVLAIENLGDTEAAYSMVFLDRFALTYRRKAIAERGLLRGVFPDAGAASVMGLGEGSVALRLSPDPAWLRGAAGPGSVSLHVEAGQSYLFVSPEAVLEPELRRPAASGLRSTGNRADYLVIGPREFLSAAAPLLERRRSQDLASQAVSVEAIYDEFGYGEARPEALKEFLEYAYHHWQKPSPRYVLLLGDGTYDGKDYLRTGVVNRVPPFMRKTSYLWTASDASYGAVNGEDELPDLAIGRLPAASETEVRLLVEKVLAYEESAQTLSGPVVLVADDPDAAGNFERDSEEIASALAGREVTRVYLRELGAVATRRAIVESFDRGASLLSYVGHGGIALWASENVFASSDVESLGLQARQPIVMTLNCLNGYFHFPYFDALAEALVKAEGKGAIAAISPSGLSLNAPAHLYHRALSAELTSGEHRRLGDAVLEAQRTYAESGFFPELLSIFHLFGDPALVLR